MLLDRDTIHTLVRAAASDRYLPAYREPWVDEVAGHRYLAATDGTQLRWVRLLPDEVVEAGPPPVPNWHGVAFGPTLPGTAVYSVEALTAWPGLWVEGDPDVTVRSHTLSVRGGVEVQSLTGGVGATLVGARHLQQAVAVAIQLGADHIALCELASWSTLYADALHATPAAQAHVTPAHPVQITFVAGPTEACKKGKGPAPIPELARIENQIGFVISARTRRRS